MKAYSMFRAEAGGILLQHPDCPDALADGDTLEEALRIMRLVESSMKLEHLRDRVTPAKILE